MLHGAAFPPVVVFGEAAGEYWLADGYHRWHAAEIAGLQTIACDVRPGGRREAILHSVGANAEHGWRRSNDDKRRAVQTLLNDAEWAQWSDLEISRRCGVSSPFVAARRPKVTLNHLECDAERPTTRTYTDRHGNTTTMRTSGIGRRPAAEPPPDYPLDADPRQLDIEGDAQADAEEAWQELHREEAVAPQFDTRAADLRHTASASAAITRAPASMNTGQRGPSARRMIAVARTIVTPTSTPAHSVTAALAR